MKDNKETVDYWLRTASGRGRLRECLRVRCKLGLWKATLLFSYGLKRLLDIAAASAALVAGSPLFGLTALLIKLEDGGPVFFQQKRVGYRGRLFGMFKFRSMVTNAEEVKKRLQAQNEMQGGVIFKMKNDPRVTRIGRIIRKYSIDELPQFWNVLIGDMSLVGPRPPLPAEVAEYLPEERQRLLAKPGITCLWQISGRSNIDFDRWMRLDLSYIDNWSFTLDLVILLKTIPAVLTARGAA